MSFIPNIAGIRALEESPETKKGLNEVAQQVADEAKAAFQREGPHPYETGEYVNSIRAEDNKVVTDSEHGVYIELGTRDTPAFHPLRQALEQSGLHGR